MSSGVGKHHNNIHKILLQIIRCATFLTCLPNYDNIYRVHSVLYNSIHIAYTLYKKSVHVSLHLMKLQCLLPHIPNGKVPDFIVCKTSMPCGDHSEASPSIKWLVHVIIPVLLTFGLFGSENQKLL